MELGLGLGLGAGLRLMLTWRDVSSYRLESDDYKYLGIFEV